MSANPHPDPCALCGGALLALATPAPARAILSDGRILNMALEKASCPSCGLLAHRRLPDDATIRGAYADDYALSAASPAADLARARAYAALLAGALAPAARVLEIGCGSGNLLHTLAAAWPRTTFLGLDPALPPGVAGHARIRFHRGFFDALPAEPHGAAFDLIFSINVIEHLPSPQQFFAQAATLLAPGGCLAIVCPASLPPNVELLFFDHLYTFSTPALAAAAGSAGLVAVVSEERLPELGDFQLGLFVRGAAAAPPAPARAAAARLLRLRGDYRAAWAGLDASLLERLPAGARVAIFGAGQMAALLRAYAPRLWERADLLVVDSVGDAWQLDKPLLSYAAAPQRLTGYLVLIATAPRAQAAVARRLAADGLAAVRFDDLIPA
ncbi:MAG: class I SAM-dependent methyltransferase [Janthinobacterium sp.]